MSPRFGRLDADVVGARVVLVGRIDDSAAALGELAALLPAGDVVLDTAGVTFVNSIGMREWMRLVRVLRERGVVTLERVADVLMTQLNLMHEHAGSVQVTSFHAPYLCPACGAESAPLIDAVTHLEALRRMHAPAVPCPECGGEMELADFPEKFLTLFRV